jgi:hypothetical protein
MGVPEKGRRTMSDEHMNAGLNLGGAGASRDARKIWPALSKQDRPGMPRVR